MRSCAKQRRVSSFHNPETVWILEHSPRYTRRANSNATVMHHLRAMGYSFCEAAERFGGTETPRDDEHVFQNLHWGLELLMKAYLHQHGWADARCIVEIRHDLAKALAACEQEGLQGIDQEIRLFLRDLSPFSRVHRVSEFVKTGAAGWTVADAITVSTRLREALDNGI